MKARQITWHEKHGVFSGYIASARVAEISWENGQYKVAVFGVGGQTLTSRALDVSQAKGLVASMLVHMVSKVVMCS